MVCKADSHQGDATLEETAGKVPGNQGRDAWRKTVRVEARWVIAFWIKAA